jgi:6-phosphogluconolactonase
MTMTSQWATGGTDSCYVEMDQRQRFCFVSNYTSGSVSVFPVRPDRSLGPPCCFRQHKPYGPAQVLPGPVEDRQEGPHAHQARLMEERPVTASSSECADEVPLPWLYVPDLGLDKVVQYRVDMSNGTLTEVAAHDMPAGGGPRHMDWLPEDRSVAYVGLEMGNAVSVCTIDPRSGALTVVQTVSTLPEGSAMVYPENSVAQVLVHPSGSFVYASNRGHDSIACFAVDASTGRLTPTGHFSTEGECPRNFQFPADGSLCVAANQNSHSCVTYRVDAATGALARTGHALSVPSPVCCGF